MGTCLRFQSSPERFESIFSKFESDSVQAKDFFIVNAYDHAIFDLNGRIMPTAFYFDYINGEFSNEKYDLEKLIKILQDDLRISSVDMEINDDEVSGLRIQNIPSYNASDECSKFVGFRFAPTEEDMEKIFAHSNSQNNSQNPAGAKSKSMIELIKEFDILGVSSALKPSF